MNVYQTPGTKIVTVITVILLDLITKRKLCISQSFITRELSLLEVVVLVGSRMNFLKYDTWNAELSLCECCEYDTNEHLIFYCQRINSFPSENALLEEEMQSSLVAHQS